MKSNNPIIAVLLLFILAACNSPTPAPTQIPESTPTEAPMTRPLSEINQKLGRGINLGNALEAPSEGEWGVTLQEEYFDRIASQGFDSVRIPVRWSAHASENPPYAIDPAFFARVDWAIAHARASGLAVVINFHHYEEIFSNPDDQEDRFLALWAQVAAHYQGYPEELIFEILNEPHDALTPARWNELLIQALAVLRETNPTRAVIVGPGEWNSFNNLRLLQLPEEDRNLIVTIHYYLPFDFTHQGAEWVDGADAWLGSTWEGTPAQQSAIQKDLGTAASWAEAHDRPIYLGEFGAYSKAPMDSRARWTDFVARTAEGYGFSWAYWEFCSGFGIYDAQTQRWNDPLVKALIP